MKKQRNPAFHSGKTEVGIAGTGADRGRLYSPPMTTKYLAVLLAAMVLAGCAATDSAEANSTPEARKCREEAVTGSRLPKRC
jgi:hypothetical protein